LAQPILLEVRKHVQVTLQSILPTFSRHEFIELKPLKPEGIVEAYMNGQGSSVAASNRATNSAAILQKSRTPPSLELENDPSNILTQPCALVRQKPTISVDTYHMIGQMTRYRRKGSAVGEAS
jgi:hypothetical protein